MWFVLNENPNVGISQGVLCELDYIQRSMFGLSTVEDVEYEDISNELDNEPCYV